MKLNSNKLHCNNWRHRGGTIPHNVTNYLMRRQSERCIKIAIIANMKKYLQSIGRICTMCQYFTP